MTLYRRCCTHCSNTFGTLHKHASKCSKCDKRKLCGGLVL